MEHPALLALVVLVILQGISALVTELRWTPPSRTPIRPPGDALVVLVLTAAVGGGHESAGKAARCEAEQAGHQVVAIDGLRVLCPRIERFLRRGYSGQIKRLPWTWGLIFTLVRHRVVAAFVRNLTSLLFAHRLLPTIRELEPDVIVSTYPLVTAALGHLRRAGKIQMPTMALITDYGVHPIWSSPGVDRHLVPSRVSAQLAEHGGASGVTLARLPVSPEFRAPVTRAEARRLLELPEDRFISLVVGGAWGVGPLAETARVAVESGAYTVVVTGSNHELRAQLEQEFRAEPLIRVLGWTRDIPLLLRAADCLIQNAGGMTCIEAIEVGTPILIYKPLPGHGLLNAQAMERAGVGTPVLGEGELRTLLAGARRGDVDLRAPRREPGTPTFVSVLEALPASPPPEPASWIARPHPATVRVLVVVLLLSITTAGPRGTLDHLIGVPAHLESGIARMHHAVSCGIRHEEIRCAPSDDQ